MERSLKKCTAPRSSGRRYLSLCTVPSMETVAKRTTNAFVRAVSINGHRCPDYGHKTPPVLRYAVSRLHGLSQNKTTGTLLARLTLIACFLGLLPAAFGAADESQILTVENKVWVVGANNAARQEAKPGQVLHIYDKL